jgi:hypothetical protein
MNCRNPTSCKISDDHTWLRAGDHCTDLGVEHAGNIEVWLQRLVDGMQGTMKAIIKRAYRNVQEMSFEDFIFSHPAQVGPAVMCLSERIPGNTFQLVFTSCRRSQTDPRPGCCPDCDHES